jgi:hypothetical protein
MANFSFCSGIHTPMDFPSASYEAEEMGFKQSRKASTWRGGGLSEAKYRLL